MSRGEIVPEVMTTLLNRSNTGLMASDGSRHLSGNEQDAYVNMADLREVEHWIRNCSIVGFEWF